MDCVPIISAPLGDATAQSLSIGRKARVMLLRRTYYLYIKVHSVLIFENRANETGRSDLAESPLSELARFSAPFPSTGSFRLVATLFTVDAFDYSGARKESSGSQCHPTSS